MSAQNFPTKTLRELGLTSARDAKITGLSVDSHAVKPGHLFAALPGTNVHGARFAADALESGAVAVLTDKAGAGLIKNADAAVVVSDDPRHDLALVASRWFGAQPKTMVAVTGTNGKTSVASFTRQIWEALALRAVNFGTTGVEGAVTAPLHHTTPEPVALHRLLRALSDQDVTHAAMEASSHGLAQRRLDGVHLCAAAFTNFTQDHLDYHEDFAAYFDAKALLFSRILPPGGHAVVNLDDTKSADILKICQARGHEITTFGNSQHAELRLTAQRYHSTGQEIRVAHGAKAHVFDLQLIGGFQASNVLAAAALVMACGAGPEDVFKVLTQLKTVRGRMELAATRKSGAAVYVDYAHTPDALRVALSALRPHVMGRLVVVFGAGGDRDKGKRSLMGQAAAQGADVVFVTDDNPRSEDPAAIRAAIMVTCPDATEVDDRAVAILRGVDALQAGDTLLIAGKGHETTQTIGDSVLDFNDVEHASIAVATLDGQGA